MDYDYSRRGYLLPDGCKDLVDLLQPKTAVTERAFVVTARLPELQRTDIEITVEGSTLHITAKQRGSHAPFDSKIEVPIGYAVAEARATYVLDRLRIVVPKAAS